MEGQDNPPSAYAPHASSGNTPPPAYASQNQPIPQVATTEQYIQYPQFVVPRQIINVPKHQKSSQTSNYNQPLIQPQMQYQPQYNVAQQPQAPQILILRPPQQLTNDTDNKYISYPALYNENNRNNIHK
eukprot:286940_1